MHHILTTTTLLLTGILLCGCDTDQELSQSKTSAHFKLFYTEADAKLADTILDQSEALYAALQHDFKHEYKHVTTLKMYPNIKQFHKAIGLKDAPAWLVSSSREGPYCESFVSPRALKADQSTDDIFWNIRVGLAQSFLQDKFPHPMPAWLVTGIALFNAGRSYAKILEKLALNPSALPTMQQLDSISKDDWETFNNYNGGACSYSIAEFLNTTWDRDTTLELAGNYDRFNEILGVSKDAFYEQWKTFLVNKYGLKTKN